MLQQSQSLPRFKVFTSQQKRRRSQDAHDDLRTSTAGIAGALGIDEVRGSVGQQQRGSGTTTAVVIAHSQLQEIREKIGRTRDPEAERRMRDKQELHDLSTRRIEKWPNTLFAVKKTKESARFEKFRVEEEERRRIDEEEAKYQQAMRVAMLERANKKIYEN